MKPARVKPRTCPVCQRVFRPRRSRVACCSKRCKTLRQWDRSFADYTGPTKPTGACANCKRTMGIAARGLCMRCYRAPAVRVLFPVGKRGPRPASAPEPRNCPTCSKAFTVTRSRRRKFCSAACCVESRRLPVNGCTVEERNALILMHRGIAKTWAVRLSRSSWKVRNHGQIEDIEQIGIEVLIYLIEHHDPTKHGALKWFLYHGVKWGIFNRCARAHRNEFRPDLDLLYRRLRAGAV